MAESNLTTPAGVLLGLWYARQQAAQHGLNPDDVWNLGIYMVLVALIVAKVWLVLSAWDYYRANPREIFSMTVLQSGGTFYGGVVGAMATIIIYTYVKKIPILPLLYTFAFAVPLIADGKPAVGINEQHRTVEGMSPKMAGVPF